MFVTTVVTASIVIAARPPFTIMSRPVMRDIAVYILAIIWTFVTFTICQNHRLHWSQTIGVLFDFISNRVFSIFTHLHCLRFVGDCRSYCA